MKREYFKKIFPYVLALLTVVLDAAYFDVFPFLIIYMAFEYLKFEDFVSAFRVLSFVVIHSALCFRTITFTHLILFSIYIFFSIVRNYFLKPFVPFLSYVLSIGLLVFFKGSYLPSILVICLMVLGLWRRYESS